MGMIISAIWKVFFAWMPIDLQVVFGALVALALIILVIRVIGMILDAIPIL